MQNQSVNHRIVDDSVSGIDELLKCVFKPTSVSELFLLKKVEIFKKGKICMGERSGEYGAESKA